MARAGASGSPCGWDGLDDPESSSPGTPRPVFARDLRTPSTSQPMSGGDLSACFSASAAGRSILCNWDIVGSPGWPCRGWPGPGPGMPWAASTRRTAPSPPGRLTRREADAPGGVDHVEGGARRRQPPWARGMRTAWDLMVMPRLRSMSMRSRYWARMSAGLDDAGGLSMRSAR